MSFSYFFSQRILLTRNAYFLSINDLSQMLEIKSKSNIYNWEKQRSFPSLDMFNKIIALFSISADWLLGYTDDPYNKNVIFSVENRLFAETIENNGVNIPILHKVPWIPEEYWNAELRGKTYSLPVRTNIAFLLRIYISHQKAMLEEQFKKEASPHWKNKIIDTANELLSQTLDYQIKQKQLDLYYKQLRELLAAKESAKPIFDIQAQKTTEE